MSTAVLLEVLAGVLLTISAIVTIAALWPVRPAYASGRCTTITRAHCPLFVDFVASLARQHPGRRQPLDEDRRGD